jgi:pyrroline-5-carboxylate reductase
MRGEAPNDRTTIGVIGAGNMGSALIQGWLRAPAPELRFLVWDKIEGAVQRLTSEAVSAAASLRDLAGNADLVLVVVKPKDAQEVLSSLAGLLRDDQVLVSAMAGPTLEWMRSVLGPGPRLFRIMPNLGVSLGAGAIALSSELATPPSTVHMVAELLEPLGMVEPVPEYSLDAVTAVSGSGPAFLALVLESLEDGAVAAGLPRSTARTLVRQTALATARLLPLHSDSAAELRTHLGAAGDTELAGMEVLESRQVRSAFQQAVGAALERSRRLRDAKRS